MLEFDKADGRVSALNDCFWSEAIRYIMYQNRNIPTRMNESNKHRVVRFEMYQI